mmetsp:Transcript_29393/g.47158  ORF Transcript_29393/g.47158 Transcript_29393/m.47158 type:complete len:131 (+) Transcript_29393:782-1174(+)
MNFKLDNIIKVNLYLSEYFIRCINNRLFYSIENKIIRKSLLIKKKYNYRRNGSTNVNRPEEIFTNIKLSMFGLALKEKKLNLVLRKIEFMIYLIKKTKFNDFYYFEKKNFIIFLNLQSKLLHYLNSEYVL